MSWIYRLSFAVLLVIFVSGIACLFIPQIRHGQALQQSYRAEKDKIRQSEERIQQYQADQKRFLSDPTFVENIARTELGWAKAGETIYRFPQSTTTPRRR